MYTINLPNRDNANLMLISEDEKTWTFKVDKNHDYIFEYMRVGYEDDKKTIYFIDPSGGPFLHINYTIDGTNYCIDKIEYSDNKFKICTSKV